ncbi:MAG: hypothetical protein WBX22_01610 [Silvibacterium sp.]
MSSIATSKPTLSGELFPQITTGPTIETVQLKGGIGYIVHDGPKRPVFNETNEMVDWASWTWNPVTGCWHGCDYCYAREIANMPRMAKVYPHQFEPTLYIARADLLDLARVYARNIARRLGEVTSDDVFAAMLRDGLDPSGLGPAAGAIFRHDFIFTGEWRKSARVSNHARVNRVWRLKHAAIAEQSVKKPVMREGGDGNKNQTSQTFSSLGN